MADHATVRVKGLRDLERDYKRAGSMLPDDVTGALDESAEEVADETRMLIRTLHLVKTGKMERSVRVAGKGSKRLVRVTAARKGFSYPRVQEYRKGSGGRFVNAALVRKRDSIIRRLEHMLDNLGRKTGLS